MTGEWGSPASAQARPAHRVRPKPGHDTPVSTIGAGAWPEPGSGRGREPEGGEWTLSRYGECGEEGGGSTASVTVSLSLPSLITVCQCQDPSI